MPRKRSGPTAGQTMTPQRQQEAMAIQIILTRCSFCVPLSVAQWEALNRLDDRGDEVYSVVQGCEHPAIKALYAAGCESPQWNGHFGRNLFFECAAEDTDKASAAVRAFVDALAGVDGRKRTTRLKV